MVIVELYVCCLRSPAIENLTGALLDFLGGVKKNNGICFGNSIC